jgi:hypothetical protein
MRYVWSRRGEGSHVATHDCASRSIGTDAPALYRGWDMILGCVAGVERDCKPTLAGRDALPELQCFHSESDADRISSLMSRW